MGTKKPIRFEDLSVGFQLLLGFTLLIVWCVIVFGVGTAIFEEQPRNAYWECYNTTYLTHEFDATNNTFYLIKSIKVYLEHDNDIHFMDDKIYRVEIKEECRVA